MDGDHRPHAIFATLFLPTESVAYVDSWNRDPAQGAHARALYARDVDAAELTRLAEALEGSIRRTSTGQRAAPFSAASEPPARFFPALGHYLWWRDCNRWTVDRLASAHLARGGAGVIFSGQVPGRLLGFHRVA
jgi:hypothetical protein